MKVAVSKLPKTPWWGTGIISYKDNPAMRDGIIPNQSLLIKERENLIANLKNRKVIAQFDGIIGKKNFQKILKFQNHQF